MSGERIEKVTKLTAALRQLETASELFLLGGDAVSAHTLAAAGLAILQDLGRKEGIPSFIKDNPMIRPEKRKEFIDIVNFAANFLKHADKDPAATMDFRPDGTAFLLFEAFEFYGALTKTVPEISAIFRAWFVLTYPNLTLGKLRDDTLKALADGIDPTNKETLRVLFLRVRERAGTTHLR